MITYFRHIANARPLLVEPRTQAQVQSGVWVQIFIVFQFTCQLALLFGDIGSGRLLVRSAAFSGSLLLLILLPGQGRSHPAIRPAYWVMVILGVSMFHPTTNGLLSGAAQAALYCAILAPLFWVPRLRIDVAVLRRVMLIIWVFYTLSAIVGILQAYFPGSFQPTLSAVIAAKDEGYIDSLNITLANGQRIFRPMGLTDSPGGAATAGLYAVLFGAGFLLTSRRAWLKIMCVGSITIGMTCLYLSQVRSVLVLAAISMLVFVGLLIWRWPVTQSVLLMLVLTAIVLGSFAFAVMLGGETVTRRLTTLIEDRPAEVYYNNRGHFLEYTINELLPRYPLGAGIGRWGMMNAYFGENSDPQQNNIWVEIQWTGWLLDGGVPLVLAYAAALALAIRAALRVALSPVTSDLWMWGGILLAYNLGAVALTFNYPLFIGQMGLEFWLLNAVLFAAAQTVRPVMNAPQGLSR